MCGRGKNIFFRMGQFLAQIRVLCDETNDGHGLCSFYRAGQPNHNSLRTESRSGCVRNSSSSSCIISAGRCPDARSASTSTSTAVDAISYIFAPLPNGGPRPLACVVEGKSIPDCASDISAGYKQGQVPAGWVRGRSWDTYNPRTPALGTSALERVILSPLPTTRLDCGNPTSC